MTLDGTHHTKVIHGIELHRVGAGSGPPVVLLHGFLAPDLRGHGATAKPATGYDKRTMAADVRELMRHLKIERAALVGHDRGARVATRFAQDFPDAIDRLVVMDNTPTRISDDRRDATPGDRRGRAAARARA